MGKAPTFLLIQSMVLNEQIISFSDAAIFSMQRHMINSHGVVMLIFNQWGEEKSHHIKIPDPLKWINSFPSRVPLQHYQAAIFFKPFKISIMCEWSFASNLMAVFSCNKVEEMLILLAGVFYETWHSKIKCHVRLNLCQSSLCSIWWHYQWSIDIAA